jgi:hypothetical protein
LLPLSHRNLGVKEEKNNSLERAGLEGTFKCGSRETLTGSKEEKAVTNSKITRGAGSVYSLVRTGLRRP